MEKTYGKIPHFGAEEDYFFGNGIVGAAVSAYGKMTMAVGCDYTCPSFVEQEQLWLSADGQEYALAPEMYRLAKTGIFSGECQAGGVRVTVTDFTLMEKPFLLRRVVLANTASQDAEVHLVNRVRSERQMTAALVSLTFSKIKFFAYWSLSTRSPGRNVSPVLLWLVFEGVKRFHP